MSLLCSWGCVHLKPAHSGREWRSFPIIFVLGAGRLPMAEPATSLTMSPLVEFLGSGYVHMDIIILATYGPPR